MPSTSKAKLAAAVLAGATTFAVAAMPTGASAAPYGFASNQISNLAVTFADGSSLTGVSNATTSVSASAQYGTFNPPAAAAPGTVGSALNIPQVYAGPGPAPGDNIFSPAGAPGSFTGSRADASIGAGSAGMVMVNNVAEGYGPSTAAGTFGTSTAVNTAGLNFDIVGSGQAVRVSFTDLIQLIARTDSANGETSSARTASTFSVFNSAGQLVYDGANDLTAINRQVGSGAGVPAEAAIGPTSISVALLTPILAAGESYRISLTSSATQTITVGTTANVPEPASLALLGAGLLGLAAVRRRRA